MYLLLFGLNHDTAPVAIREQFSLPDTAQALARLGQIEGVDEALLLATCNRTEVLLFAADHTEPHTLMEDAIHTLFHRHFRDYKEHFYAHQDEEAVFHLCEVAAGLDSMLLGEDQIIGQVKQAKEQAEEAGTLGGVLTRLLNTALHAGKRARTETAIGQGSVSVAGMAVRLAEKVYGDLKGKRVMLVGAGKMSELTAQHLMERGISEVVVTNKTHEKAVKLARQLLGRAVPFENLHEGLMSVDIVITSTACPKAILQFEEVKDIMRRRRWRPLFLFDIAVPRDVDPRVGGLDNVYLYDIDDLRGVVEETFESRKQEIQQVKEIVRVEGRQFLRWYFSLEAVPLIKHLLEHYEQVRVSEMERFKSRVEQLGPEGEELVDELTRALTKKFLHKPLMRLREVDNREEGKRRMKVINAFLGH